MPPTLADNLHDQLLRTVHEANTLHAEVVKRGGDMTSEEIARTKAIQEKTADLRSQIDAERQLRELAESNPETANGAPMNGNGQATRRRIEPLNDGSDRSAAGIARALHAMAGGHEAPGAGIQRSPDGGYYVLPPATLAAARQVEVERAASAATNLYQDLEVQAYDFVRPRSVLDFLGVRPNFPIEWGEALVAWLSTSPDAVMAAEDASLTALAVEAAQFQKITLSPVRTVSGRGLTIEAGLGSEDITAMVSSDGMRAIEDKLQQQIVNGSANPPQFPGLFQAGALDPATDDLPATKADWATVIALIEKQVDGEYANSTGDLRLVCHPDTSAWLSSLVSSPTGDKTARSYINQETGGLRVSKYAPAPDTSKGTVHKILCRRGNRAGSFAWAQWIGMGMLADNITAAGVGTKYLAWSVNGFTVAGSKQSRADWKTLQLREAAASG